MNDYSRGEDSLVLIDKSREGPVQLENQNMNLKSNFQDRLIGPCEFSNSSRLYSGINSSNSNLRFSQAESTIHLHNSSKN